MSQVFKPVQTANVAFNKNAEPYSLDFDDVYYSSGCGLDESIHVFIEGNDLIHRFQTLEGDKPGTFVIAELGFGTGLNFLLTMRAWFNHAPSQWKLHYLSVEKHPLKKEDLDKSLKSWVELKALSKDLLKVYPVLTPGIHRLHFVNIALSLLLGEAEEQLKSLLPSNNLALSHHIKPFRVNAWYLDGFSPSRNNALWKKELFEVVACLSDQGTTAASYSVAKPVKEALRQTGFDISKKKGFGRKREMLVAQYKGSQPSMPKIQRASPYYTPWQQASCKQKGGKADVMILGAGLAGCSLAHQLASLGCKVLLLEKKMRPAEGASGNIFGILDIKLSGFQSPQYDLLLQSYLYALGFYKRLGVATLNGMLRLALSDKDKAAQIKCKKILLSYPRLARLVDVKEGSRLAGISLKHEGMYFPMSGFLSPKSICEALIAIENIDIVYGKSIESLKFKNNRWHVEEYTASSVVIAAGHETNRFSQTQHIPLIPSIGLVSHVKKNRNSSKLAIPLSANGYIVPVVDDIHMIGGSYGGNKSQKEMNTENCARMLSISDELNFSSTVICGDRMATRATTSDRLPMVGPVPMENEFIQTYRLWAKDGNTFIPKAGPYYPGMYIFTGFGSHGLTLIPLASVYLSALILGEPSPFNTIMQKNLSPARFLVQKIKNRQ